MPKNIVIFSDGTGQDGGARPEQRVSNIYKLYRVCRSGPESGIDPARQIAFYDPGLGTDIGATALTAPVRFVQKLLSSMTGRGITTNIAACYEFIIDWYEPGDRIYLIGFSRGAYTVRCLANLLMLCGVPTRTPDGPLPRFRQATADIAKLAVETVLEHGAGHPRKDFEAERDELARRFRADHGSDYGADQAGRSNVAPHFVGVFETVAALGARGPVRRAIQAALAALILGGSIAAGLLATATYWLARCGIAATLDAIEGGVHPRPVFLPVFLALTIAAAVGISATAWFKYRASVTKTIRDFPEKGDVRSHQAVWKGENFDRLLSEHVHYARSANGIDERRKDFDRVGWGTADKDPGSYEGLSRLRQVWFAGNHSDIGGSYPEVESRLSDFALQWMMEQTGEIPGPLIIETKMVQGSVDPIAKLRVFPLAAGLQHCEVAAMQDLIELRTPRWLRWATRGWSWHVKDRYVDAVGGDLHHSVRERLALETVPQAAGHGPYRPEPLRNHPEFAHLYERAPPPRPA